MGNFYHTCRFSALTIKFSEVWPRQIIYLGKQFYLMKRYENILKTSLQNVLKTSWRCLEDVLKTSWRSLAKTSWRLLQNVLKTSSKRLQGVLKTSLIRLQNVLKTSSKRLEDVFARRLEDGIKSRYFMALKIWVWESDGKERKIENASYRNRISNAEFLWKFGT